MSRKILIVEDEAKISRLLEIELESEGYEVAKADNGLDGLSAYRSGSFDLVLLDVMLPGMSGIELLRRIRSQDTDRVILRGRKQTTGIPCRSAFFFCRNSAQVPSYLRPNPGNSMYIAGTSIRNMKASPGIDVFYQR